MVFNFDHPNIIKCYSFGKGLFVKTSDESQKEVNYLVLEYSEHGELFDFIADTGPFSEREARYFF